MDVLGWDNPLSATDSSTVQPCHWSNQQHEIGESFIGSTYNADQAAKGFFHFSNHHEFQGIEGCENSISNSNRLCEMVQHELAPALDSTNAAPNLNLMQREESINQYGDVGTSWRLEPNVDELCSSSMIDTRPYSISSPFNGIMEAFTTTKVGSLMESLDCLMSLKNNAETSAKDQENIENLMFLADCRNLCEFGSGSATAVSSSSGESHNNISNDQETKNSQRETVSQASSNPCTNNNSRPSGSTSNSSKRKEREPIEENGIYPNFNLLQSDCFNNETGFRLITEDQPKSKIPRLDKSSNISFQFQDSSVSSVDEPDTEAIAQMKEMIYRAAAFRSVNLGLEVIEKPKRKNVKISSDPQTVAARQRRERVSERIRVLQKLVPGGSKMDTASMLDEAANYLKFLKSQVKALETLGHKYDPSYCTSSTSLPFSSLLQFNNTFSMQNPFQFPQP